jgi:hypothetical protein
MSGIQAALEHRQLNGKLQAARCSGDPARVERAFEALLEFVDWRYSPSTVGER